MAEFDRAKIRSIVKQQFGRDLPEFNIEEGLPRFVLKEYDFKSYLLFESDNSLVEFQLTDAKNHDFAKRTRVFPKEKKVTRLIQSAKIEFKTKDLITEYFVEFNNKGGDRGPGYGGIIVWSEQHGKETIPLLDISTHKNTLQNVQFALGEIRDIRQHEISCLRALKIEGEIEDRTINSAYIAFPGVRFDLSKLPYFTVKDARLNKPNDIIFSGSINKSRDVNPNEIYPYFFKFYLEKDLLFLERYNMRKRDPAWVSFFPLNLDGLHLSLMSNNWIDTTTYFPVRFKKPD